MGGTQVNDLHAALDRAVPLQGLIGYVNFSEGRPDPRFQKQLSDAYAALGRHGAAEPWRALAQILPAAIERLRTEQAKAFSDVSQATAVVHLVFAKVLPAYREHHVDLLGHLSDHELFQPFFLARVFESVLAQRGPWDDETRLVAGALKQLNDYVGHRPIAVLESRPRGEPYERERFRPVPIFIKGAGVAWGKYHDLLERALEIVRDTDLSILQDACFDPGLLDELAVDPRGYDFAHPADKRPNYVFGEWDPHHLDQQGRFRRFIVRKEILDGLVLYVEKNAEGDRKETLTEAAALLGGTILMAAGVSGASPTTHDSTVSLGTLVPRIARYREAYYARLLEKLPAKHAARLREDAKRTRQPFGATRQALNLYLSQQRAYQLQQRHLAILFADIGCPEISRRQIEHVPVASVRFITEMHNDLTIGHLLIEQGEILKAAELLPIVEELLHRGIRCGALPDPWNILGFQAHYPRFTALEDSVRDQRIDELMEIVDGIFSLYGKVLSEGAATGLIQERTELLGRMRALADWWDAFASVEVSDVERVHGGENVSSAENVANALEQWRLRGEADLTFWRDQLDNFRSPKAFAHVVDALLRKKDYQASMALLMTWLQQAEEVPLEKGDESFHVLALRWMLAVCGDKDGVVQASAAEAAGPSAPPIVQRFFDYLEANADVYWQVPRLDLAGTGVEGDALLPIDEPPVAEEDDLYGAAYEDFTYRDSTDDDVEAEVLDIMPEKDFDLSVEAERLEKRLQFLTTVARLWNVASRIIRRPTSTGTKLAQVENSPFRTWAHQARDNYRGLLVLLDAIHEHDVPKPTGTYESMVEFDRRRLMKERLLGIAIVTCLDNAMAVGALRGALNETAHAADQGPPWEPIILQLEQALWRGDVPAARQLVPGFLQSFRDEPLLYTPLSHGGHPRQILRASIAQIILRGLVANLPRLGVVRETYSLIRAAHEMERRQPIEGPRITEFDHLFRFGSHAVAEAVVDAAQNDGSSGLERARKVVDALQSIFEPFVYLWIEHSSTLRVATLEGINSEQDWRQLRNFIQQYGADLFDARFMTVANLRGILHRGVGPYFDYLRDNADPLHPIRLIDDLDKRVPRGLAERMLSIILQCIIENYEEYRDYNATTTQSDYGQNLHQLLDFLRLKARYERDAWRFKPVALVHEVLARRFSAAADLWRERFAESSRETAATHLQQLAELEKTHSMRLATINDYLNERFMKSMEIDRLCAHVEPAMEEVRHPTAEAKRPTHGHLLERAVEHFAATPAGAGFDVPGWIRRLEQEVQRYHGSRTALVSLAENLYQIPKIPRSLTELQQQMDDLGEGGA